MLVRCVENMPCCSVVARFKESALPTCVLQCGSRHNYLVEVHYEESPSGAVQCNAELVLCNVGTRHVLQCRTHGAMQPAMPPVGGSTA